MSFNIDSLQLILVGIGIVLNIKESIYLVFFQLTNDQSVKSESDNEVANTTEAENVTTIKSDVPTSTPLKEENHDKVTQETTMESVLPASTPVKEENRDEVPSETTIENDKSQKEISVFEEANQNQLEVSNNLKEESQKLIQNEGDSSSKKQTSPKKQKIGTKIMNFFHVKPRVVEKTKEVSGLNYDKIKDIF